MSLLDKQNTVPVRKANMYLSPEGDQAGFRFGEALSYIQMESLLLRSYTRSHKGAHNNIALGRHDKKLETCTAYVF